MTGSWVWWWWWWFLGIVMMMMMMIGKVCCTFSKLLTRNPELQALSPRSRAGVAEWLRTLCYGIHGHGLKVPPMLVDTWSASMWIKKAWLPCWPSVQSAGIILEVNLRITQVRKHVSMKTGAHITRSPKQGYQCPQKGLVSPKNYLGEKHSHLDNVSEIVTSTPAHLSTFSWNSQILGRVLQEMCMGMGDSVHLVQVLETRNKLQKISPAAWILHRAGSILPLNQISRYSAQTSNYLAQTIGCAAKHAGPVLPFSASFHCAQKCIGTH